MLVKPEAAVPKLVCETQAEIRAAGLGFRTLQARIKHRNRDSLRQQVKDRVALHILANRCKAQGENNALARMLRSDDVKQAPFEIEGMKNLCLLRRGVSIVLDEELFDLPVRVATQRDSAREGHSEEMVAALCRISSQLDDLQVPVFLTKI